MKIPIFISFLLFFVVCNAQCQEAPDTTVYKIVEQMPRFPGCENMLGDDAAKKKCADAKFLAFLFENLKWPQSAKDSGADDMFVISFVVMEDGSIADIKILKNPGYGIGEEGARVVELMNTLPERWTPGKQNSRAVRVKYNLPVRVKLKQ